MTAEISTNSKDISNNTQIKQKLGIIAGGGDLPNKLITWCKENNRSYFVLAIKENADTHFFDETIPHKWIRIGEAGSGFHFFKEEGVKEVVLIGVIKRPSFAELIPDFRTTAFFAKLGMRSLGDDGILKALVKEIEGEGMRVVGIHEVMPELLASHGNLTTTKPSKEDEEDIRRGVEVSLTLGKLDVGQSVVIQQGLVLGVEGIEGTDKLICRCKEYARKGKAPILVKLRKPQQDMRVDLPTIGVKTVENAHKSGFKGIAIHAGNVLVVNEKETIKTANKYGLFIKAIEPMEYE